MSELRQKKGSDKATPAEVAEFHKLDHFASEIAKVRKARDNGGLAADSAEKTINNLVRLATKNMAADVANR